MAAPDPSTVQDVFTAVCLLPADQRPAALANLCGDNAALLAEVEALLALDTQNNWLDDDDLAALRELTPGRAPTAPSELPEVLGDYRIEGLLGRGGVGVVYRARQQTPERAVALKVLPPSPSQEAARRFALEQASLARLQHPAIAQIYAAGSFPSASGAQPFLAMELIEGDDLRRWLERTRPASRQRIELWIAICEAVHHAHQKGVVHRDLKPANILIDAQGRPKIVDFGIARMLEQDADAGDTPQTTLTGQVLGTPAYMSPEQADGRIDLIDTRTDVYALGVIGYVLLAERLPIDVSGQSVSRAIRSVVEDDPVPIGQVAPQYRGDVQTILTRCLQKRPDERYSSAMALAEDLRRHLQAQPITAREPTALYVLSRFARRHRTLLFAAATVLVALGAALWVSLAATADAVAARTAADVARGRAEAEAKTAQRQLAVRQAVLQFLSRAFHAADPYLNPQARQQSPGELLAAAGAGIDAEFAAEPLVARAIHQAVGDLLLGVGEAQRAIEHLQRALAITDPDGDPWRSAQLRNSIGLTYSRLGQPQQAVDQLLACDQQCAALTAAGSEPPADLPFFPYYVRQSLAECWSSLGERGKAEQLWRHLLDEAELDPALAEQPFVSLARSALAGICAEQGRQAEAEQLVRRALDDLRASHGELHEATLSAASQLCAILTASGQSAQALELQRDVLAKLEQVFGPDHPNLLRPTFNLVAMEWQAGEHERALEHLRSRLAAAEADPGTPRDELITPYANLGKMLWTRGERDEAARHYQRAIDLRLELSPGADVTLSGFYYDLARIVAEQGDQQRSLELRRESVRIRIEALGPLHAKVIDRRVRLAEAELRYGDGVDAALPMLEEVDAALLPTLGVANEATTLSQKLLTECMLARGDRDRARVYFGRFQERAAQCPKPDHWDAALAELRRRLDD
ncbi:MAG: serine/threonine-protein kinase [Planctomycetota bacterium]